MKVYTHSNYPEMRFFNINSLWKFLEAAKSVKKLQSGLFRKIIYNTNNNES